MAGAAEDATTTARLVRSRFLVLGASLPQGQWTRLDHGISQSTIRSPEIFRKSAVLWVTSVRS
jgi:hypothetical protein